MYSVCGLSCTVCVVYVMYSVCGLCHVQCVRSLWCTVCGLCHVQCVWSLSCTVCVVSVMYSVWGLCHAQRVWSLLRAVCGVCPAACVVRLMCNVCGLWCVQRVWSDCTTGRSAIQWQRHVSWRCKWRHLFTDHFMSLLLMLLYRCVTYLYCRVSAADNSLMCVLCALVVSCVSSHLIHSHCVFQHCTTRAEYCVMLNRWTKNIMNEHWKVIWIWTWQCDLWCYLRDWIARLLCYFVIKEHFILRLSQLAYQYVVKFFIGRSSF